MPAPAPSALHAILRLHASHATIVLAKPPLHACAPTHAVVHLVPADAHLVPANAHAGGDHYTCRDHICMRPLPTLANVAT
jgi:hypothetical protein